MISKRARRSSTPQENLKQFSLNSSRGVDITKAPTDPNTVFNAKNLIVNTDGSVSLRKPIKMIEGTETYKDFRTFYLYDGVTRLDVGSYNGAPRLRLSQNGTAIAFDVVAHDYTGRKLKFNVGDFPDLFRDDGYVAFLLYNSDISIINTNSTSIVCNARVRGDTLEKYFESNVDNPDTSYTSAYDRYLSIYFSNETNKWTVELKNPEVNVLTAAEGEASFNPNLALDNPTALRDTYNVIVPSIKGILAYAPTRIYNNGPVYNSSLLEAGSVYKNYLEIGDRELSSDVFAAPFYGIAKEDNLVDSKLNVAVNCTVSGEQLKSALGIVIKIYNLTVTPSEAYADMLRVVKVSASYKVGLECTYSDGTNGREVSNRDSSVTILTGDANSRSMSIEIPASSEATSISDWDAVVTFTVTLWEPTFQAKTVSKITESSKTERFSIANSLASGYIVLLKAFCNLPKSGAYYAAWTQSEDGIVWEPVPNKAARNTILVRELDPNWAPSPYLPKDEEALPVTSDFVTSRYEPLSAISELDTLRIGVIDESTYGSEGRADIILTPVSEERNLIYRFKIISVEALSDGDVEFDPDLGEETQYRVRAVVSQKDYTPNVKDKFEFFEVELGNASRGKKLYHKNSIYSYGYDKFLNNILVSDAGSFVTPLYNVLDLNTYNASQATCIVPWRDYLVSATPNALYLHTKDANGFFTKTVNTSIGIPEEDYRCCKPILNGIVFKSGAKVYQAYPNLYAGDDSTLNVTDISTPIEDYLESYEYGDNPPLAFSTSTEYVLMLPNETDTTCLRYDYSSKLWTVCVYPVVVLDYRIVSLNDIHIFGTYGEYTAEFVFDADCDHGSYFDVLRDNSLPIEFEWDTGQKTDSISHTKQFVESKLMFATLGEQDSFPFTLYIAIDGDPHVTRTDVSTDAPFWKTTDGQSRGVLGTAFALGGATTPASGNFNTLRQFVTRYSGKGKSIRHVIVGASSCNFKLYETYVRYKNLNVKQ